jgi:outer membrane lipoprotein-sorting protein
MKIKFLLFAVFCLGSLVAEAQDADEIISRYFIKAGGLEAWKDLKSMKMEAIFEQENMSLQAVIYREQPDKNRSEIIFQGDTIVQAFDGETGWMINPMMGTSAPQKMPEEMAEMMKEQKFESELVDYREKGHMVELEGTESVAGSEAYKIKLTRNNGDTEYYFFDTESNLPVMERRPIKYGPMEGQDAETFIGDYREVEGMMLPHTIEVKSGGQTVQKLNIKEYALNEDIEDSLFSLPGSN